ncbi:MAG: phenylalanine--tRNA ligase subunit alpha [Nitrospinota bacterium]|nr:MAG: phenylalanine--tRNA ligase subunit alpha [Nitrospinota bacterium]
MREALDLWQQEAVQELTSAQSEQEVTQIRIKYLGRKGLITGALREIGSLPPAERRRFGQKANQIKAFIEKAIADRLEELRQVKVAQELEAAWVDVTLPGRRPLFGRKHPLTQVLDEVVTIFIRLGFSVAEGPEIELDYYNFEALNIPKDHPARDMQDTFYLSDEVVLRTHTSPVQVRVMEQQSPPVRIIAPGKVYRCDADITHTPMFHQVEGLVVDEGISFADLKGVLELFVTQFFGPETRMRFRPSYFPFTEPSAEVDIQCVICQGKGCALCHSGWLEILGAGMVDPAVYSFVNYDPERFTGFAFGMGIERLTMLKYGIDNIRLFFENDLRFLRQF